MTNSGWPSPAMPPTSSPHAATGSSRGASPNASPPGTGYGAAAAPTPNGPRPSYGGSAGYGGAPGQGGAPAQGYGGKFGRGQGTAPVRPAGPGHAPGIVPTPGGGLGPGGPTPIATRRAPRLSWVLLSVAVVAAIAAVALVVLPAVLASPVSPEGPGSDEQLAPFTGELPMSESHGVGERPRVAVDRGDDWGVGSVYLDGDLRQEQFTYEPADCAAIVMTETGLGDVEGSASDQEASEAYMAATVGAVPPDAETITVAAFGGGSIEFAHTEYESSSPDLPYAQLATRAFADSGTAVAILTLCADHGDLSTAAEDFRDRTTVAIELA